MKSRLIPIAALLLAACSTTRRLADDEVLYTGVRKMRFVPDSGVMLTPQAEAAARKQLSVKPNNPLFSPYLRTPFPVGLWAYNHLYTTRERGVKHWLYNRLAKTPVLISDVQPRLRVAAAASLLADHGYFGSVGSASLIYRNKGRKARVEYDMRIAPPWFYSSVDYPNVGGGMQRAVDSLRQGSLLHRGAQYNLDTLTAERARMVAALRNEGYYYLRPDYLEYLADTTLAPREVALRLRFSERTPPQALQRCRVGSVTVTLEGRREGVADTVVVDGLRVISQARWPVRERVLERCVTLRRGDLLTPAAQSLTVVNLNKTGIFRSVDFSADMGDSAAVRIVAREAPPVEVAWESDITSKSNSFLGPGMTLRLSHNNLFRGGEVLTARLEGSYEWQTGRVEGVRLHSYEAGVHLSLDIPRLLPARLMQRTEGRAATSFEAGADLVSRPDYFRMVSLSASAGWEFGTSEHSRHALRPVDLTYNNLLATTAEFDKIMDDNPALALSFRDKFVPASSYIYTLDKRFGASQRLRLRLQSSTTIAGNLISALSFLAGQSYPQSLFGLRFSQFAKQVAEMKLYIRSGHKNNTLAMRFLAGAGFAYGNSEVLPYGEQFYIGGANSIRAFTVRSIGPGGYRPTAGDSNGFLDQTGDFKVEANIEYRFGIAGNLNGALFLDAGNVWLMRRDTERPRAELNRRTFWQEVALGAGVGLRYDLSVLVLRLDVGFPLHYPYDTGHGGYFNVGHFGDSPAFHLAIGYPF